MWFLNFGGFSKQGRMLFLQRIPHKLDRMNLFTYNYRSVLMYSFILRALLAIVRLGLILSAVCLFAEVDHFISAARTLWHYFNLEEVSQGYLRAAWLNHLSFLYVNFIYIIQ
jgi:hypothetical protein